MTNNNISSYNIPEQFLNYINYELSFFEKITNKKFFFIILNNDRFELNVYESKEEKDDNDNSNKSEYQVIYRSNNLYQFIKNLFILREYLIKNIGNK
ncbi:MAG TPA: hypothetical protein VFM28_09515 [Nitrososphaeraceae archaeon]|nr:hypothetical protein [Nitrososphaeraceae archaeon]